MSQQARLSARYPAGAVAGNTARALTNASPAIAEPTPPRRTPLVLVPTRVSKRRTPFVVFCFFTLVTALGSVLVLNVSVSSGQYRLVELNNRQLAMTQENEMLTQQLKNQQAPQNLAAAATELGMVVSSSFGAIDLGTLGISGKPEAAKKSDGAEALVPAPDVAIAQAPEAQTASPRVAEAAAKAESEANAKAATEANAKVAAEAKPEVESAAERKPVAPEPAELNGGTIPAPKQQSGQ